MALGVVGIYYCGLTGSKGEMEQFRQLLLISAWSQRAGRVKVEKGRPDFVVSSGHSGFFFSQGMISFRESDWLNAEKVCGFVKIFASSSSMSVRDLVKLSLAFGLSKTDALTLYVRYKD